MKKPTDCENMEDIRQAIDSIDEEIVKLIARRAQYVENAAKFKKTEAGVRDEQRVRAVIASKKQLAVQYGASPHLIGAIYQTMIEFFINAELEKWKKRQ